MSEAFDSRLLQFTVSVEDQVFTWDQNYYIRSSGTKYTDGMLGECAIRIDNIAKSTRDFLVKKCVPWQPPPAPRLFANIQLEVGRASTGTFLLFAGQAAAANPSQPPDIGLTFQSLANQYWLGNIGALNMGPMSSLSVIAQEVATLNHLTLQFKGTDFQVGNFSFTGAVAKLIDKLKALGNVWAFPDNGVLVVLSGGPTPAAPPPARNNSPLLVNSETGMIGVPETDTFGLSVKMLINSELRAGDLIQVQSTMNPAANGVFTIFKLGFDIATWEAPWYWNIWAKPAGLAVGFGATG
jgi:hypothetical protein